MKRWVAVLIGVPMLLAAWAAPALAQYPPGGDIGGEIVTRGGGGVGADPGLAFAGIDITLGMLLLAVLLVLGTTLLVASRHGARSG